jgi:replicative DNA helicase
MTKQSNVPGNLQPSAVDIERQVLGIVLMENVFDRLTITREHFYHNSNKIIFDAIVRIVTRNHTPDSLSLMNELISLNQLEAIGGPYYITTLTEDVRSSATLDMYCAILHEKYIGRQLITIGSEMQRSGFDQSKDVFDSLDAAGRLVYELSISNNKHNYSSIDSVIMESLKQIELIRHSKSTITGVPTGIPVMNALTAGWQNTDLIIVAARPATGKTAYMLNLARNAALDEEKPTGVGIFSLEMNKEQLVKRMISAETEIPLENIMRGRLDDPTMKKLIDVCGDKLAKANIHIDDTAAINILQLRAKARKMKNDHNIGLLMIDYLQLMSGTGKNQSREQEVSQISRDLKGLAKELCIPIIALSQLSRKVEDRGSMEPRLSDLRESGAIEQDADMVQFLYRPASEEVDSSPIQDVFVKIAKHRNGPLDRILLKADLSIQKFNSTTPF